MSGAPTQPQAGQSERTEVSVRGAGIGIAQQITARQHTLRGDEPVGKLGEDSGPAPMEYLLAALGSCTAITVRLYARHKGWPVEDVRVAVAHQRVDAASLAHLAAAGGAQAEGKVESIERRIELVGPLDDEQRRRLLEIANRCPIHRTLTGRIDIQTTLV